MNTTMELDEMKSAWNDINARLEKSEITNKNMITKLINSNAKTSLDKLVSYEKRFFIISILVLLLYFNPPIVNVMGREGSILFQCLMGFCMIEKYLKIKMLKKINLQTDDIIETQEKVVSYKLFTIKMKKIGWYGLLPLLFIIIIICGILSGNMILLAGMLIGGVAGASIGINIHLKHEKDIDSSTFLCYSTLTHLTQHRRSLLIS